MPINVSSTRPWKAHYLYKPLGLMLSTTLGQVSYVFPPPALVPMVLSKFMAEHMTGQFRLLMLVAPCWMEASWLPTVFSILKTFLIGV